MKVVSFRANDVDEIQEMVTRPLGDVDPWSIEYTQTERGLFGGSYQGAALPRNSSVLDRAPGEAADASVAQDSELLRDPAVYTSRHLYDRRLHICGRAPLRLIAFIVPLNHAPSLQQKGQAVGPDQLLSLAAGEELDATTRSGFDFLSVRLDPAYVDGLADALDREDRRLASGVLTPGAQALQALKWNMLRCFEPADAGSEERRLAVEQLTSNVEESLIAALGSAVVETKDIGVWRRQAVARLAREYMQSNLDRAVSTRELCSVTGASARTLQYVFRWYFGVAPRQFHLGLRLAQVRRRLKRGNPDSGSITDAAVASGFTHLSRFAADYKTMFGELPSETHSRRR